MMAKVILICGKICCGKTTYAHTLCKQSKAVLLSVDEIMLAVFGQHAGDRHDEYAANTKEYLLEKSLELIKADIDVILDWGCWTRYEREEIRAFYRNKNIPFEMHYIDIDDNTWKARIEKRNQAVSDGKTSAYFIDENLAAKFAARFEIPNDAEIDMRIGEIHGANECKKITKTRVGCRAIVIENDRMLISHEVNTNYYLIPGGGLEDGETPEACCVREVREETGYIVKPVRQFLTLHEYYEDCKYTSHYFVCEIVGKSTQKLTAAEAERGLTPEWISPDKMLEMYAKHADYASINEEKRGSYQREYTALTTYLKQAGDKY